MSRRGRLEAGEMGTVQVAEEDEMADGPKLVMSSCWGRPSCRPLAAWMHSTSLAEVVVGGMDWRRTREGEQ